MRALRLLLPLVAGAVSTPAWAAPADCSGLLAKAVASPARRPLESVDLLRLRDFGSLPDFTQAPVFSVSPDGSEVAVQLRRADPVSNGLCLGMVVIALDGAFAPRLIDQGGELIRWHFPDLAGKADFPTGFAKVITPRWFPDGKAIAFLKQSGGVVQVWRAAVDGSGSVPLTRSKVDVVDFRIVEGGRALIFSTKPALVAARAAIGREGQAGFHYDDRFSPNASSRPFPAPPLPLETYHLDLKSQALRRASADEAAQLAGGDFGSETGTVVEAGVTGRKAWARPADAAHYPPQLKLAVEDRAGREQVCEASTCTGITGKLWWNEVGDRVRFMRREGWGDSMTAIYEWKPGEAAPRRLLETSDMLFGCQSLADDLICAHEGSVQPRQIVRIDLSTDVIEPLFDPNPDFRSLALGRVERLHWKSAMGVESFGDLVYPTDYRPGRRYPLIIVQYRTRGFLRGGTGDEQPIQAYANRGYFVLSVDRPRSPARPERPTSYADLDRADLVGFVDRRNVLSAIEVAVTRLVDRGLVDRARIGITGLSDGASTVQYAALHSNLFAVASISGCCWEPGQAAQLGPAVARQFAETGWPKLTDRADEFWSQISWVRNADRVKIPLLMQLADSEFRSALAPFTAIREVDGFADMYVFPDEPHVKWQPAHRLAIYQRNLDWFDFWLKGKTDARKGHPEELARWIAWKDALRRQAEVKDSNGHAR